MEHKQGERESCLHRGFENMCFRRIRRIKLLKWHEERDREHR